MGATILPSLNIALETLGRAEFYSVFLPACHGLRTPATTTIQDHQVLETQHRDHQDQVLLFPMN